MKPLSIKQLQPGMVLAQDVYAAADSTMSVLRCGTPLDEGLISRLAIAGVATVHIESDDRPMAKALLQTLKTSVAPPPPIVTNELRKTAVESLEKAFQNVLDSEDGVFNNQQLQAHLNGVVGHLVDTLVEDSTTLVNITDLKSYDDYTYHHSLSVSVVAIALGQALGVPASKLNQLGIASIMHDIGKTAVPIEIIRKPSRLDKEEFDIVKTHPSAGTEYLVRQSVGDELMWRAVLHHHEKTDGTGYPHGLKGDNIPLWSRIIAVADVFDALTSNRPYRQPMPPAEALEYLMGGVGSAFDYDVVCAMLQKVELYPVGSCVELSNGRYAVVLGSDNRLRPVIEVLGAGTVVDLANDYQYLSVVIKRLVPEGELGQVLRKSSA